MAKTSAKSNKAAKKKTKLTTHADICVHHSDPREGLCTASINGGRKCTFRAKAGHADFLPTCGIHKFSWMLRAGRCQAITNCGQACNRIARYDAPYHFCFEHEKGTNTLPCHFLSLSTELRLMIYRYIFPDFIPCANPCDNNKIHETNAAILRVNKQISQEASSVLYGELQFHARITPTTITVLGKTWHRSRFNTAVLRSESLDINKALCMEATKRIRNLFVEVSFGSWRAELQGCTRTHFLGGVDLLGITNENYDLYEAKDTVRKLVELFPATQERGSLKRLTVQPKMGSQYRWSPAERVAAMFLVLEPFQDLHVVQQATLEARKLSNADEEVRMNYEKLQEEWISTVKAPTPARTSAKATDSKIAYRKIEHLVRFVKAEESQHTHYNGNIAPLKYPIFDGIERPLHLARVACENEDPEMIDQIRRAIAARWDAHQQQQQRAAKVMSNAIKNMLASTDTITADVWQAAAVGDMPVKWRPDPEWIELQLYRTDDDLLPKRRDPGVTIEADSLRVYYHLGDQTWVRLKTPEVVRMKKVEKQLSQN
jgi:hypothetical protein